MPTASSQRTPASMEHPARMPGDPPQVSPRMATPPAGSVLNIAYGTAPQPPQPQPVPPPEEPEEEEPSPVRPPEEPEKEPV